ncbi:MAG: ABC transporter substrate-binding protein [Elusimicrobiaceae bacterium]|jgi:branched-chain amino acid transport system substrate-binding protein
MKKIFLLAAACVLLAGCSGDDASTVKIGLIAELTGDMPAIGASCKNGAEMAVKALNDAGGIELGGKKYKVKLIVEDNAGKPEQSAAAAQKLISRDKVVAIIGPNATRYAIPASEIAESSKVPLITPWSTNPKTTLDSVTGASKKYVFRACFSDSFQGEVLANFIFTNMKLRKVAVLYDVASDANKGIAEVFKNSFESKGGKITAFETYTTSDKDFTSQLTKIKQSKPEIVFLPNYYSEVPLQVQQAHRLGINVPFFGGDSWGTPELIKLCGDDCEGFHFSTHYAADMATPAATKFIADYKAAYGTVPDDVAALTYDSFEILFSALRTAQSNDREAVRGAIAELRGHSGVTGEMKFVPGSGDPIKSAVILQISSGTARWFANVAP